MFSEFLLDLLGVDLNGCGLFMVGLFGWVRKISREDYVIWEDLRLFNCDCVVVNDVD